MGALVGAKLLTAIFDQRAWILAHGGDLAGYVRRYGSAADADHYGNGGEAIYQADCAELERLERLGGVRERRER